jgi:ABC-type sugar transport system ATPase subunit
MVDPTRGVDVRAKAEIHRLVGELAGSGVAVLVVSSDLPEIVTIADRVGIVRRGRLVAELDGRTTTAEEVLSMAAGGISA